MDSQTCIECRGKCCGYVSIEIDEPTNKEDMDDIRWYLMHKNVNVYIDEDRDWFVEFQTPCEGFDRERCEIYDDRPKICRDHGKDHQRYGIT